MWLPARGGAARAAKTVICFLIIYSCREFNQIFFQIHLLNKMHYPVIQLGVEHCNVFLDCTWKENRIWRNITDLRQVWPLNFLPGFVSSSTTLRTIFTLFYLVSYLVSKNVLFHKKKPPGNNQVVSPAEKIPLFYSYSIVAGGLLVTSYSTRLTCLTSLTIRTEIFCRISHGIWAKSAVIPSIDVTARMQTA